MTPLRRALAVLAVMGFVAPYALLAAYVADHGLAPGRFLDDCFASAPAALATTDLSLAFVAFAAWAVADNRRRGIRAWWAPLPASLLVGLCFAVPLHFLMRERGDGARRPGG